MKQASVSSGNYVPAAFHVLGPWRGSQFRYHPRFGVQRTWPTQPPIEITGRCQLAALAVTRSILALVVVLAMAAAVGVVFAMFASPRGCGVYTVEAGSGAIRCVEVKPKVGANNATDYDGRCAATD
jgi:hypothetical protein